MHSASLQKKNVQKDKSGRERRWAREAWRSRFAFHSRRWGRCRGIARQRVFIIKKGYRDGVYGFAILMLSSVYVIIAAQIRDFSALSISKLQSSRSKQYQDTADEHIHAYEDSEIQPNV